MRNVQQSALNFFDEAGINLNVYSLHEIIPRDRDTLFLLCSLEVIDYAKIIEGAADNVPTILGRGIPVYFTVWKANVQQR